MQKTPKWSPTHEKDKKKQEWVETSSTFVSSMNEAEIYANAFANKYQCDVSNNEEMEQHIYKKR